MRIFLTGASGFIGSAIVTDLLGAGHEVLGLARSEDSAAAIEAAGANVHRGSLEDLDSLRAGARDADGVIHTAFIHDFSNIGASGPVDLAAIEAFGAELAGSERPLVVTSGTGHLGAGRPGTEEDMPARDAGLTHRVPSEEATLALAERGVRTSLLRLPPSVHGEEDKGFMPMLIAVAREKGFSAYVGDGENRWPAVHRLDAARLFRLAAESAPAGSVLHGVADEGVPFREIAEGIGRGLDVPVRAIESENAFDHFGWLGALAAIDIPATSLITRELLGWRPEQPGLIADLDQGHYFAQPAVAAER